MRPLRTQVVNIFLVPEGDHVDVLNNAFVNYVGTVPGIPTAQHTAEFSGQIRFPVCDPQLVALTCETLNNETKETWHNALDARLDVVQYGPKRFLLISQSIPSTVLLLVNLGFFMSHN